ncbi:MAG: hypothetical protein ACJATI_005461 [Halioglobus sp.]|jgi:hypothetical protein
MFPGFGGMQYYEDENQITKNEVCLLMEKHELTKMHWSKSKKHNIYSIISFGSQLLTSYFALKSIYNSNSSYDSGDKILFAASIGSGIAAIGFSFSSASLKKKAILGYNKSQSEEGLIFHIGQTHNGIGLVCSF